MRNPAPAKALIVASGRSQTDVARAIHTHPNLLNRVLNGRAAPWPALIARLAEELGVDPHDLFDGEVVVRRSGEDIAANLSDETAIRLAEILGGGDRAA